MNVNQWMKYSVHGEKEQYFAGLYSAPWQPHSLHPTYSFFHAQPLQERKNKHLEQSRTKKSIACLTNPAPGDFQKETYYAVKVSASQKVLVTQLEVQLRPIRTTENHLQ